MSNILVNIKGLSSQEFPKGVTPLQIMSDTKGVSKDSIICKVDGVLTDLSASLSNDCDLQFMDAKSKDGHSVLLHSTAHLMAQAVKRLFPKKSWNKLHLQIIYYGREYCKARECYGVTCKICTTCYPKRKKPIKTKKP